MRSIPGSDSRVLHLTQVRGAHSLHTWKHQLYASSGQGLSGKSLLCRCSTAGALEGLLRRSGVEGDIAIGQGLCGLGLYVTKGASKGDTILSVPTAACLIVDYTRGLQVPAEEWPRLQKGLQRDIALPWDVLLGLALLDGLSGDGGAFWEDYANSLLPQPEALSLPCTLPSELLTELQHPAIINSAIKQQERLRGLFPGLATPMEGNNTPTYMQWGLACVRSRAFQLGKERFAMVPFLDIANHAPEANAAFRNSKSDAAVELVAVSDIVAGQEAVISYTECQGTTNMRMMQQYGFVLSNGNPADRVAFSALDTESRVWGALSIQHLEAVLGDMTFVDMMGGRLPYLVAAMKSLPLREDSLPANTTLAERRLVEHLIIDCSKQLEGCSSSIQEDTAVLEADDGRADSRMKPILQYRLERKRLLEKTANLLRLYRK